jgi:hypothetical protein
MPGLRAAPDGPPPADPDQPVWDYLDGVPPGGWTSIRNSPARRAVWEGGGDPDDPRNYDPEPESEGQ